MRIGLTRATNDDITGLRTIANMVVSKYSSVCDSQSENVR
jgi:hypothetical protein